MGERSLSEQEWKRFARGRELKDAGFLKALAVLEKAGSPEHQLQALGDVEKQADGLRRGAKGDRDLIQYLADVDKALDKQRKLSEAEARQAARSQEGEEEDETPALLTTKMIPLLRQVRKGEEMQALLASNGKEMVALLSRRAISPSRRKLLIDYLGGGTLKFFPGHCLFEENAYTFVVRTQAAGMAKKLKAALLKQLELRVKVRVRGEAPDDVDDDGDPAPPEDDAPAVPARGSPAAPAPAPTASPQPAAEAALAAAYRRQLAQLEPRLLAALKTPRADASKLRAVAEFAREKSGQGKLQAALSALASLEKLLAAQDGPAMGAARTAGATPSAAPAAAPSATSSTAPTPTEAAAPAKLSSKPAGAVDYAKCRLVWEATKKKVAGDLRQLEQAILSRYQGRAGLPVIATRLRKLDAVLDAFADDLSDLLDQALSSPRPAERERLHREAAQLIRRFLHHATHDPFIAQIEANPFVPVAARAALVRSLGELSRQLG